MSSHDQDTTMDTGKRTALYDAHVAAGASMVRVDGWELPSQYSEGPAAEHLWTRSRCSICDFSHLSRISIAGADALSFLQRVLTSNVAALELGSAQYGILANENGSALDEGYLYRFEEGKYLFVGNAAPRERTLAYLREAGRRDRVTITDDTFRYAAIAVQGPDSEKILKILSGGREITDHRKGSLNILDLEGRRIWMARTGYTGGSGGYEAYLENADAVWFWERLQALGARPAGLTARDTLRIEAGLPHFGQEFGLDREGKEMPIFAVPLARFAVSFAEEKGDFVGKAALARQYDAFLRIQAGNFNDISALPWRIIPIALTSAGALQEGMDIRYRGKTVGYVTSAATVPYFRPLVQEAANAEHPDIARRSIGLAYLASELSDGAEIEVDVCGQWERVSVVARHM